MRVRVRGGFAHQSGDLIGLVEQFLLESLEVRRVVFLFGVGVETIELYEG
jgi:hypothetical protein